MKLLAARLTAEYFEVIVVNSGPEALELCREGLCDVVLLDVMMPEMDGLEVCRQLKADIATMHLPIIMITALDSTVDRIAGLEAGVDDFLTKPVRELALTARVRSLTRLKMLTDELRTRSPSALEGLPASIGIDGASGAKILVVEDRSLSATELSTCLSQDHEVAVEADARRALKLAIKNTFELVLISLDLQAFDSLRLCAKLRSSDHTRMLPILVMVESETDARLMRALDLGVNDYLLRPVERNELKARVRTQLLRKRYADHLRDNTKLMLEMATMDGLTHLTNRRRFEEQFAHLVEQSLQAGKSVSMLLIDIDHFKSVNDTYGHPAGDKVLVEFGRRLRGAVRDIDLAARFGGEEFVVAMPETDRATGFQVAERLREILSTDPFRIDESADPISVTVSVGVAALVGPTGSATDLLARADAALYRAKRHGRNRVVEAAA